MNETVLFWVIVALAYIAGAGTLAVMWLFRLPHPGRRTGGPDRGEGHEPPPPLLPAPVAPVDRGDPLGTRPRTLHRGHDTMDVYDDGLRAGRAERYSSSAGNGAGWENGTAAAGPPPAEVWGRPYTHGLS